MGKARLAVVGGLAALASWGFLPEPAGATEPEPEPPACVGFACLDEATVSATIQVGAFGLGLVAGRGLWG